MLYRTHDYSDELGSEGYEWHTTKKEAERVVQESGTEDKAIFAVPLPRNESELLTILRKVAEHPNNG